MKKPVYRLRVPEEVASLIRGMHPHLKRKVKAGVRLILSDPAAGKELKDELEGLRSFRVAKIRIVYRVKKQVVELVAVGPRDRIYRETWVILKREKE